MQPSKKNQLKKRTFVILKSMYGMMKYCFICLLFATTMIFGQDAVSQEVEEEYTSPKINFLEMNASFTNASGFFERNFPKTKFGFEAGYLRQIKPEKPLFWGISLYYAFMESQGATFQEPLDFGFADFDYNSTTNLWGLNGKLRFYPNLYLGKLETYLEAQLGYKWIYTGTTKSLVDDEDSSDFYIEKGSLSLTYGISAGLNYPVSDNVYINFRANYLPGLSVPYYVKDERNVLEFSSIDKFNIKNSTTDIIRWDVGVTFWPSFSSDDED